MDLANLRVYPAHERGKTTMLPVLVITDGDERIIVRPVGDPVCLQAGADRLVAGAVAFAEQVGAQELAS